MSAALEQLPAEVSAMVLELRAALEVSPWTVAPSVNPRNPDAEVRCHVFEVGGGEGMVWYQVTESLECVDLLRLVWHG
ncbi:hypothetical protein Acsp06_51300 [Actinomycetospora sp. NBRC 106375]|uniref:hypothetical protein n=1 Tax=Actinomycetospora sp. NBRC 106375 TaxID=3032207 RepID=UPI0024A1E699|nr:hypothetical protein [Actinomycetospora sp. NBRC 106375]GLZ48945.1 hypothetical protein Acsp06_51300 [Actinomycetospora sp. NBRC 106375]